MLMIVSVFLNNVTRKNLRLFVLFISTYVKSTSIPEMRNIHESNTVEFYITFFGRICVKVIFTFDYKFPIRGPFHYLDFILHSPLTLLPTYRFNLQHSIFLHLTLYYVLYIKIIQDVHDVSTVSGLSVYLSCKLTGYFKSMIKAPRYSRSCQQEVQRQLEISNNILQKAQNQVWAFNEKYS